MAMEKFTFGNLPIPPAEYSPEHLRQAFRVLELYFNQLDSLTPNQAESYRANYFYGGEFISNLMLLCHDIHSNHRRFARNSDSVMARDDRTTARSHETHKT